MQAAPQRSVVRRAEEVPEASSSLSSAIKHGSSMTVSPPVYFLVREQAKSHVAIRELQDRIRNLEESQGSLVEVVGELQLDLSRSLLCQSNTLASTTTTDVGKSFLRPRFNSSDMDRTGVGKKNYSKGSEESSDNKQDSGVDSDCQAQLSVTNVSQPKNAIETPSAIIYEREDELLTLLDLINQRGTKLRQRVDEYEDRLQKPEQLETLSYQDVASLLHKCRSLQKKLKDVVGERDYLRSQLDLYDSVVTSMKEEKRRLEERLDGTTLEKRQLESKIHKLHGQFVRGGAQDWPPDSQKIAKDVEKAKRLKRRSLDENKTKISDVLKEKSLLELQRQMLHMILENESMAQSLVQSEQQRLDSVAEWGKRELQLRYEIQNLSKEKADLNHQLGQSKIENTDVLAKVKLLERALQAVSQDSKLATQQLENTSASLQKRRASASTYNQMLKPKPSPKCVFQSLPPQIAVPHNRLVYVENEIHPLHNTSSYLNISFEEPELEALENPQLDFRKCLPANRSSTPIRSKDVKEKYTSRLDIKACSSRSEADHADLTSICSEFDPLAQGSEGKNIRIADFVDSLDALPANNVMFVPVSVAKVPMNAEIPKYASPLLQRVPYTNLLQMSGRMQYPVPSYHHQNAKSVDASLL